MVALEVYLIGKGKRIVCSIYLAPADQVKEEDMRTPGAAPSTYDPAGKFHAHTIHYGETRIMKKILERFNPLCINKKEETYYRVFDGSKSTIET